MKIGDRVKYETSGNTYYGVIVGEKNFKCKCKGRDKWMIDFGGEHNTSAVPKNSDRLIVINPLEIKKESFKHTL